MKQKQLMNDFGIKLRNLMHIFDDCVNNRIVSDKQQVIDEVHVQ